MRSHGDGDTYDIFTFKGDEVTLGKAFQLFFNMVRLEATGAEFVWRYSKGAGNYLVDTGAVFEAGITNKDFLSCVCWVEYHTGWDKSPLGHICMYPNDVFPFK